MAYSQTHLLLCAVLLGVAASSDVSTRSVPNAISAAIAVTGLVAQAMTGGVRGAFSGLAAALVLGALLTPFWSRRIMAAGDVKLGVAAATWVGLARSSDYLLASAVAGTFLAATCALAAGAQAGRGPRVLPIRRPRGPLPVADAGDPAAVPYGVAFVVGALFALQSVGLAP